jgi:hypothetical protein
LNRPQKSPASKCWMRNSATECTGSSVMVAGSAVRLGATAIPSDRAAIPSAAAVSVANRMRG